MVHRDGAWHLDGAVLCFPSAWVLGEKIGRSVADVHGPVDHYATDLEARVDVFFDRFRIDRPVWRRNMSFKTTHALFLPYSKLEPVDAPTEVGADGSPYWIRSERQTLRKLPAHRRHPVHDPGAAGADGRAPSPTRPGGRRAGA